MKPFRRTAGDAEPASRPGAFTRFAVAFQRRLLICWLLGGAFTGVFGFLSLFSRRSTRDDLVLAAVFGGVAVVSITVLAVWLRIAMRRAGRDQA